MNFLQLVNQSHPLDSLFIPKDLMRDPITGIWLVKAAYEAFYKLNQSLQNEGFSPLVLVSGYRSYEYQKNLFNKKIQRLLQDGVPIERVREEAATIVALPGCSEHQLGLALDVTTSALAEAEDPLIRAFGETTQGVWLVQNAHLWGFVLRYTQEKQCETGITYEPWHYRYVGINHAKKMTKLDLCLEEYLMHRKTHNSF
ncbi:MAG: M15 family metallopeptidase [Cellulosilyticaceae bacterium]